jgi:hypothetical protein
MTQNRTTRRSFPLLALLFLPLLACGQGLYWETSTSVPMAGEQAIETKSYYLPRMFKQGSEKEAVVFRLDKQVMYVIDYKSREYSEITFEELEVYIRKSTDELRSQLAELREQLASMPEDQRKMMEQMMGGQATGLDDSSKVEVKKTKESKTISGYACVKYSLMKGKNEAATVWTTTGVPDFKAMQKDFKEFSQKLASQMSVNGPQMAEAMQKVDGFAVETSISGMTATVKKVSRMAVGKSEFEVPAGFKKVAFEEQKGRRGGLDEMDEMDEMDEDGEEGAEDDSSEGGR